MLYIDKNPETVEAFLYLEEPEPEWFLALKEQSVFIQNGRKYIETAWGVSALNRGEYICRTPNSKSIWVESKSQFESKYKPYVETDGI